jgi:hypothetical protein
MSYLIEKNLNINVLKHMFKEIKESIMKISHQIEISMMQYKLK